jgi:hypothetical protein
MRKYSISHFPKLRNSQKMTIYQMNWEKLAQTLTHPRPIVEKKKQQLWSPTTFSIDGRKKSNALWTDLLVFDVDENNDYGEVKKRLQDLGVAYIMHTTNSHTTDIHKFRVVLALEEQVDHNSQELELWPFYYARAIEYWKKNIGNEIDEVCKDVSRAYFVSYGEGNPHYWSDWSPGKAVSFLELAKMDLQEELERRNQEELEKKIQAKKEENYRTNRLRNFSHTDWKKVLYDNLRDDPGYRLTLATNLGCKIQSGRAEGFNCPDCGRNDATFFYLSPIPYSSGFCGHRNSCGDQPGKCNSFSLYRIAKDNGLA